MRHIKTIIVGGGPSGSICGYLLKKKGEDCVIIDRSKFPREKLCGGGLTPKTYILLDRIFDNLTYDYKEIKGISLFYNGKKKAKIELKKGLRTVTRKDFDNCLINKFLKIGGELINNRVSAIEEKGEKIILTMSNGTKLSCNYLVGADGTLSVVREYLEPSFTKGVLCLEQKNEEFVPDDIHIGLDDTFDKGYYFVFPNNKYTAVGYGEIGTSIEEFERQLDIHNVSSNSKTKGAYIAMLQKPKYKFLDNILLIGDAGGYVDSLTGEGLYYAFKTGENAALAIINGVNFKKQNEKIIAKMKLTRTLSNIFYSKIGKFLTKIALESNWFTTKALNRYLSW